MNKDPNMDKPEVAVFNKSLVSMYEMKIPISKQKIMDITKNAMSAIHYFKHVVLIVEKFICKCKPEYKVPGFYVIDSIVRAGKKQYKNKDVFGPRFAVNLRTTLENALKCEASDRLKIVRVLNLWLAHSIFDESTLQTCLQFCKSRGLDVNVESVEKKVKGKANLSIYNRPEDGGARAPKTPPLPHDPPRPRTPTDEPSNSAKKNELSESEVLNLLIQLKMDWGGTFQKNTTLLKRVHKIINEKIHEKIEIDSRRQGNIKNLLAQDFDYSDEEEVEAPKPKEPVNYTKEELHNIAQGMIQEPAIRDEIQRIYNQSAFPQNPTTSSGYAIHDVPPTMKPRTPPMPMPAMQPMFNMPPPGMHNSVQPGFSGFPDFSVPPPTMGAPGAMPPTRQPAFGPSFSQEAFSNIEPPPGVGPTIFDKRDDRDREKPRKRERSRSKERSRDVRTKRDDSRDRARRDRSRDRDRERDRDRRRERSRSRDRSDRRSRDRRDSERKDRDRKSSPAADKDNERTRRRNGLPQRPKDNHVLIASRTLWFGRVPSMTSEDEIKAAVAEAGVPERINIIGPRACAYVTMPDRRSAFKIMDRMAKDIQIQKKSIKLSWAVGQGLKNNDQFLDYWDSDRGISQIPHSKITLETLELLLEGSYLDVDTLPSNLKGLFNEKGLINKSMAQPPANTVNLQSIQLPSSNVVQPQQLAGQPFPFQMTAIPATSFIMPHIIQPVFATTPGTPQAPGFGNVFQSIPTKNMAPNMPSNQLDQGSLAGLFSQPQTFTSNTGEPKNNFDNQRGGFGGRGGRGRGGFRGRGDFGNRGGFDGRNRDQGGFRDNRSRFGERSESRDNQEEREFGNTQGFGSNNSGFGSSDKNGDSSEGFGNTQGFGRSSFGDGRRGGRDFGNRDRDFGGRRDRDFGGGRDRDFGGERNRGGRGGRGGRGDFRGRNRDERRGSTDYRNDRHSSFEHEESEKDGNYSDLRNQIDQLFAGASEELPQEREPSETNERRTPINEQSDHQGTTFQTRTQEEPVYDTMDKPSSVANESDSRPSFETNDPVSTSVFGSDERVDMDVPPSTKSTFVENPEVSSTTFNDDFSPVEHVQQETNDLSQYKDESRAEKTAFQESNDDVSAMETTEE